MSDELVVIIGGGSAGIATAITLSKRGISSLILEASDFMQLPKIGETLPPSILPLLKKLDLASCLQEPDHLPCYGNQYLWGNSSIQEKLFLFNPHGNGWHLDRFLYEKQLQQCIQNHPNIHLLLGYKVLKIEQDRDHQWQLVVRSNNKTSNNKTSNHKQHLLTASFVVDATGRKSQLAKSLKIKRQEYGNLIGLAATFDLQPGHQIPQYTYIEAVENGWWYAVPLPHNRLMMVFMTDADLLNKDLLNPSIYQKHVRSSKMISSLLLKIQTSQLNQKIIVRQASSSHLQQVFGAKWLAVGDAAFAYDPISSYGLVSAIGSGFYAGNAVADHLDGKEYALPTYGLLCEKNYQIYLEMLNNQYCLEQRWSDSLFWQRRQRVNSKAS